jgi:hypothetical protein
VKKERPAISVSETGREAPAGGGLGRIRKTVHIGALAGAIVRDILSKRQK